MKAKLTIMMLKVDKRTIRIIYTPLLASLLHKHNPFFPLNAKNAIKCALGFTNLIKSAVGVGETHFTCTEPTIVCTYQAQEVHLHVMPAASISLKLVILYDLCKLNCIKIARLSGFIFII